MAVAVAVVGYSRGPPARVNRRIGNEVEMKKLCRVSVLASSQAQDSGSLPVL